MFDAEARGTPEGTVKIPCLGSEKERKFYMLAVVVSNLVPHDSFLMVLDALNHQRRKQQILLSLKMLGKGYESIAGISP